MRTRYCEIESETETLPPRLRPSVWITQQMLKVLIICELCITYFFNMTHRLQSISDYCSSQVGIKQ